jgi:hypothetical protein
MQQVPLAKGAALHKSEVRLMKLLQLVGGSVGGSVQYSNDGQRNVR